METVSNAAGRASQCPPGVARALVGSLFWVLKSGRRPDGPGLRTRWGEKAEAGQVSLPFRRAWPREDEAAAGSCMAPRVGTGPFTALVHCPVSHLTVPAGPRRPWGRPPCLCGQEIHTTPGRPLSHAPPPSESLPATVSPRPDLATGATCVLVPAGWKQADQFGFLEVLGRQEGYRHRANSHRKPTSPVGPAVCQP